MKNSSDQICKKLGKSIRLRREKLKISQEKLAYGAELHRNYISRLECGNANPSLKVIFRIACVLEVHLEDLFK